MAKVKRMGRPPLPAKQRLSKVYGVRFRPDEEQQILRAIARAGKAPSDWIRETLLSAARSQKSHTHYS